MWWSCQRQSEGSSNELPPPVQSRCWHPPLGTSMGQNIANSREASASRPASSLAAPRHSKGSKQQAGSKQRGGQHAAGAPWGTGDSGSGPPFTCSRWGRSHAHACTADTVYQCGSGMEYSCLFFVCLWAGLVLVSSEWLRPDFCFPPPPPDTARFQFSVFALFGFPSLLTLWLSLSSSLLFWGLTGKLALTLASLFTLLLLAAVVIRLWSYMYICVSECYHA